MLSRRAFTQALLSAAAVAGRGSDASAAPTPRYPAAAWHRVHPAQSGWSAQKLRAAQAFSRQIGSSAVFVVQHGAEVASWGDTTSNLLLNSARKSLLSALIGIAVGQGQIRLDATMAQLGIDDTPPPLTGAERLATVRDLLEARSGVYHTANYETPGMQAHRPARGSHPPGTFWYYNNWDFNTLGAIYEHATGRSVFSGFARQIAAPLGMQDFNPMQCRYFYGQASRYPAYLFFASARDLARFGLLYLRQGRWAGRQVVPADWVRDSTQPYSVASKHAGYGYLWWTLLPQQPDNALDVPPGTYWALGNGGQMVLVIPAYDMVMVHLARTRAAQLDLERVSVLQVFKLLSLVCAAMPGPGPHHWHRRSAPPT